jgi:hypothetical protein
VEPAQPSPDRVRPLHQWPGDDDATHLYISTSPTAVPARAARTLLDARPSAAYAACMRPPVGHPFRVSML